MDPLQVVLMIAAVTSVSMLLIGVAFAVYTVLSLVRTEWQSGGMPELKQFDHSRGQMIPSVFLVDPKRVNRRYVN